MKKFFLFFGLAVIINVGCQKKLTNPFENLGVSHNQIMDSLATKTGFLSMDRNKIYDAVYPFISAQSKASKMDTAEYATFINYIDILSNAKKEAPALLLRDKKINKKMKDLLGELYTILLSDEGSTNVTPAEMTKRLKDFETTVMRKHGTPSTNLGKNSDVAMVIAGSAIARYSYAYWFDAAQNPKNVWHLAFTGNSGGNETSLRTWWGAVKADVGGFFSGDCFYEDEFVWDLNCAWSTAAAASAAAR